METNRYIIDIEGTYEAHDGGTRPVIIYRDNNEVEIGQLQAYNKLGISNVKDNSNVVLFIHGFNFTRSYAAEVFNRMIDKICAGNTTGTTKFICVRWNSSANDVNDNLTGSILTIVSRLFPGAVGDEIKKTGNSGFINNRYVEDLERVANSLRGLSWIVNDLAKSRKTVSLIGHSMGCQAVVNCLSYMCHDNSALASAYYGNHNNTEVSDTIVKSISNVFLIAPDVNVGVFKLFVVSNMARLSRLKEFIIYSNDEDIAIYSSELIRVHNHRLGGSSDAERSLSSVLSELDELQYIVSCVNKVDVLNLGTSTRWHALEDVIFAVPRAFTSKDYPFSHNYYTNDSICRDIGKVIFGGIRGNVRHHRITGNTYYAGSIS